MVVVQDIVERESIESQANTRSSTAAGFVLFSPETPGLGGMAKTEISSTDLVWVFTEKLRSFGDCAPTLSIAIVPSEDGWRAIASRNHRHAHPLCAKRIEQVQKQLREIYVLAKD
jgi:hypothetical protein